MATHHAFPNLQASEHPLVRHKIRLLADKHTEPKLFRELTKELTALLVYEATRDLPTREVTFETPLGANNLDAPAATYTSCRIAFARWRWRTPASMRARLSFQFGLF